MELKRAVAEGKTPKKALFDVTEKRGGLLDAESSSHIPKKSQVYELSRKSKKDDDPLKKLIGKQLRDGSTGDPIIQKIETNTFSYNIVLFKDRMIKNIANFCCTNIPDFRSPYCWDFTFNLGRTPPYFALVTSYQNTTLLSKRTKKCPVLLGPILLCHKKDETNVKLLCDAILDKCPGLGNHLKVLGADGEKSIINQTCNAFPSATLLVCTRHVEENIKRNLPKAITEKQKSEILKDIFGSPTVNGLTDCFSLDEFDKKLQEFYVKLSLANEMKSFAKYFKRYKEDILKYHVMQGVVDASEITGNPTKFYNNSLESMNSLIKKWQNYKKVDLYTFAKEYQDLVECQENDVLRSYLGLDSSYEVRDEI